MVAAYLKNIRHYSLPAESRYTINLLSIEVESLLKKMFRSTDWLNGLGEINFLKDPTIFYLSPGRTLYTHLSVSVCRSWTVSAITFPTNLYSS